jgi:hypothetical protein
LSHPAWLSGSRSRGTARFAAFFERPVQTYYTVALIAALGGGILNVVLGLMAMIGS